MIIESEASGVVSAIYDGFKAVAAGSVYELLAALSWFEQVASVMLSRLLRMTCGGPSPPHPILAAQAMSHVASNCLRIMFDRSVDDGALCEPELFFNRLRPFISTWTALFQGCASSLHCATLHCITHNSTLHSLFSITPSQAL